MSFTSTPETKMLFDKMRHIQARQETASDNMARSGVAGAKTKEVESFEKTLKRGSKPSAMKSTNAGHLTGSIKQSSFHVKNSKNQGEPSISGNSIDAGEQLSALTEAATNHLTMGELLKANMKRINMIVNIGGGK